MGLGSKMVKASIPAAARREKMGLAARNWSGRATAALRKGDGTTEKSSAEPI